MLEIYVDADACPVKEEVIKVAMRHDLTIYFVSNSWLRPINNPKIHIIKVEEGPDVADDWIVEHMAQDDIVITADILLADRCLKNDTHAINPSGKIFTQANIGSIVAGRNINNHLREIGAISGNNPSFSKQDRSQFLQELEKVIQQVKMV